MDWADAREENDTLIIVTADHGQGFDVFGSVDTQFFNEDLAVLQQQLSEDYGITSTFTDEWKKRASIGMYESAGYPDYEDLDGDHFPDDWKVRTTFAADKAGHPDMTEDFQVKQNGPRASVVRDPNDSSVNQQGFYFYPSLLSKSRTGILSYYKVLAPTM